MKHISKAILLSSLLLLPTFAEEVMKITLSGEVSDENLSSLSKIVFEDNAMVAGATYNLDEIEKIEFYNDGTAIIDNSSHPHSATSSLSQGQIGFTVTASQLQLNILQTSNLSVSLYSLNGRKVAELFNGSASAGALNLNLTTSNLAPGIYSVMVKAENTVFVRKIVIK